MRSFDLLVTVLFPLFAFSKLDEQRCYWAKDRIAPPEIIPCYLNSAFPFESCCRAGDLCLQRGACFNYDTNTTYQYGCTDKAYENEWCPLKCDLNRAKSNWVSLVYCTHDHTYICHHPDTCGKKCPQNTPWHWDPREQKLSPIGCKDIKPSRVVVSTTYPISSHWYLPTKEAEVRQYLSRHPIKGTSSTPLHTPPHPPSSSPPPRPPSPPPPPPPPPSSTTAGPMEPSSNTPSSFHSAVSPSSESEPIISIPSSTNASSEINSSGPSSSVDSTQSTTIETGTEKPDEPPPTAPPPARKWQTNVGIGVGVGLTTILCAAASVFYCCCWRRNPELPLDGKPVSDPKPIMDQPVTGYDSTADEIAYGHQVESPGERWPTQIESPPPDIAELSGSEVSPLSGPVNSSLYSPVSAQHQDNVHPSLNRVLETEDLYNQDAQSTHSSGIPGRPGSYTDEQLNSQADRNESGFNFSRTRSCKSNRSKDGCPQLAPIATHDEGLAPPGLHDQRNIPTTPGAYVDVLMEDRTLTMYSPGMAPSETRSPLGVGLSSPEMPPYIGYPGGNPSEAAMPAAPYGDAGYATDLNESTYMPNSSPSANDGPSGPGDQTFELSAASSRELKEEAAGGMVERQNSVASTLRRALGLNS